MTQKEKQRDAIRTELEDGGVVIETLPGGCMRLYGAHNNMILLHDLATLTRKEVERLCSA